MLLLEGTSVPAPQISRIFGNHVWYTVNKSDREKGNHEWREELKAAAEDGVGSAQGMSGQKRPQKPASSERSKFSRCCPGLAWPPSSSRLTSGRPGA